MKRITSKAVLLKKRVKSIQGRAKFVGVLYLLGILALAAAAATLGLLNGTVIAPDSEFPAVVLPVLTFYQPIVDVFSNLNALTMTMVMNAVAALFFTIMLLVMAINILRALSKLNWLFKVRASYTNGFNRNMYAMDDLGKIFSSSLAALVICNLFIYLLSDAATITTYGYIAVGGGLFFHFVCGLIGGTVTLFTTGENVEEEPREHGLVAFFFRNLIQLAAAGAILYFFVPNSIFAAGLRDVLEHLILMDFAWFGENLMALIPFAVEVVLWLCVIVLIKHATAATEYNRDCMDGAGMKNYAVFAFFTAICLAALIALPYFGIGAAMEQEVMTQVIIAAAVALVAFIFDCAVKPRVRGNYDDLDMDTYFRDGGEATKFNNTIV